MGKMGQRGCETEQGSCGDREREKGRGKETVEDPEQREDERER